MSTAQDPEQVAPVVDPPAAQRLTAIAAEPTPNTGKPLLTDSSMAESRSEGSATVDAPATDAAAVTAPTGTELEKSSKKEAMVESQPINEGFLGYKGPGLVKSLISSKKYFWFSEEPVESKQLSEYLRNEKPDAATVHHNVAHASQTGKGLLFYAKRAEDKDHPVGIFNLSEATDLSKGDFNDFAFKLHGHKHDFKAPTKAERDGWLVAIETRSSEAKAAREGLIVSEGYKSHLEKLTKPATPIAVTAGTSRSLSRPKRSLDGSKVHDGTSTTDNVAVAGPAVGASAIGGSSSDDDKTKGKSRSRSRKRGSIFGALLHKKEDHEEKKEIKKEEKAEDKAIKEEVHEDKAERKAEKEDDKPVAAEATEPAPLDAAAVASRVVAEPVVPIEGTKPVIAEGIIAEGTTEPKAAEPSAASPTREVAPKPSKRNSIFGFFGKKDAVANGAKDTTSYASAKDSETTQVSATAPQLDDPVTTTPTDPTATSPVAADSSDSALPVNGPTGTAITPDGFKDKRRTSFFGNLGTRKDKRTDTTSDAEVIDGDSKKSTPPKFGGLFRKPSRRAPSGSRAPNNIDPPPPALPEPTETALVSKDAPGIADHTGAKPSTPAVDEPTTAVSTGHSQPAPVPATA